MKRTAILFICHIMNEDMIHRFLQIASNIDEIFELYWMMDTKGLPLPKNHNDINFFPFTLDDLNSMDYKAYGNRIYENVNFIPQYFYIKHSEFDYYWVIEYDVLYTGNWNELFISFIDNKSDFIASHVEKFNQFNMNWEWWQDFQRDNKISIRKEDCLKSFNPIHRISNKALRFMDKELRKWNPAHCETTEVTLLYYGGFKIEDLGGTGEFVPKGRENKYYVNGAWINSGTMRYLPPYLKEEIYALQVKDKLFHPIK